MKDLMVIWNTLSRCQISVNSSVNINPNIEKQVEQDETRTLTNLQRKSSVMVNKFFNTALPVDSHSRQNWSKSKYEEVSFHGRAAKSVILFLAGTTTCPTIRHSRLHKCYIYTKTTVRFLNMIYKEKNIEK
ncbi:hypothetical protein ALC56_00804 [Trachymyrmex septentrionalis]|uniref:Uncharacterized protein n=1 Tax=Trachymyrmex septentrionalis TaxID=34720 RepID=A0A195FY98_9HYME|nr:hypothetical protein ALC56_00804 [Trachymyrmex septentrionalis]